MMNEHIATVILFDETEALLLIKPLYFTFWHRLNPPFSKFSQSRIAALTERKRPPRPKGHGSQPLHFNMSDPTCTVPSHMRGTNFGLSLVLRKLEVKDYFIYSQHPSFRNRTRYCIPSLKALESEHFSVSRNFLEFRP
jgi:hypothetical protein